MKRPRDWTPGPILVALCATLVAAGALWLLWTAEPVLTLLAGCWAALTGLCVLGATRNLRARLENAERLLDAWNSSEARDELALSPPAGTPTVDPEPPEWMSQSGYRPPRTLATGHDGEWVDISDSVVSMEITKGRSDPATCVYDADPAQADRVAAGAADCGCFDCWGWLKRNGYLTVSDNGAHLVPPMTVAETDRLIGQLQALPGECPFCDQPKGHDGDCSPTGERIMAEYRQDVERSDWHLGQPCNICDAPATAWVSDRPGPEISDVTFLCDECYTAAMSEEDGRG